MAENARSGNAFVMRAMFASDIGKMAGPPKPQLDTSPSTLISNSSVSGSMRGSDGNVFEETMASAPPRKQAPASSTMSCVAGVSFVHTGTFATPFTASVTVEQSTVSLPMLEPMSFRSMCGHEKLSSRPSAPASWHPSASVCHALSSLSFPGARHDRRDHDLCRMRLLDAPASRNPPLQRLVRDQLSTP